MDNNQVTEPSDDDMLTTPQAAQLLGISPETLTQWRQGRGKGPRFVRLSHTLIRYVRRDVLAWRDARTVGGRL